MYKGIFSFIALQIIEKSKLLEENIQTTIKTYASKNVKEWDSYICPEKKSHFANEEVWPYGLPTLTCHYLSYLPMQSYLPNFQLENKE